MSTEPRRRVEGRTLVSDRMPPIRLRVAESFDGAGRLRFVLYGVARVESFLFVAHDHHRVERLLLVQFEGYLDHNDHVYDYPITETVTIGGHAYLTDAAVMSLATPPPPDSDVGRALARLGELGYVLPAAGVSQRFVRVLDETKRNELLILYAEDLGAFGLTVDDVAPGGPGAERWDEIARSVRERALASFTVLDGDRGADGAGPGSPLSSSSLAQAWLAQA